MLYRWGFLVHRAKLLKYLSLSYENFRGVEFVTECLVCGKETPGSLCRECHKPLLRCTLCRLPVRGAANACLNCGHGGHTDHMRRWFEVNHYCDYHSEFVNELLFFLSQKNEICATGCGCLCLIESENLVNF